MDLGCAKIASLIKGKNPKCVLTLANSVVVVSCLSSYSCAAWHGREIRETFGLHGDFGPKERQAVKTKYPFLAKAESVRGFPPQMLHHAGLCDDLAHPMLFLSTGKLNSYGRRNPTAS